MPDAENFTRAADFKVIPLRPNTNPVNKKKILNDPVYGFVTIPNALIFDLIEHPVFQRLRRIKQVGLTHYVYPGALHTRFHHALGAMHLMQEAIDTLRSKGIEITADEAEGALASILLHDIGHGPYSHALEGVLFDANHETLTTLYMSYLNDEMHGALDLAIEIFHGRYEKKFLRELISSQLDLDRMDYLKRDSFFTGVAEGHIGHDRIIKMLGVVDDRVVVEEKGIYSIEKFLMARRLMYWQVYLHKAVIAAEQMLRQLMLITRSRLRRDAKVVDIPPVLRAFLRHFPDPVTGDAQEQWLHRFAEIDDVDVEYAMKCLAGETHQITALLADGLVNRRLFHTRLTGEPHDPEEIRNLAAMLSKRLDISFSDAQHLIITGYEEIPTYKTGQDEILMLRKDGDVVTLSEMLNIQHDTVSQAYFLCYPKLIR